MELLKTNRTTYCFDYVKLSGGNIFYVDGNGKITRSNGSYDDPKPNAFSLPHISTCPGATKDCMKSCYVNALEENARKIYDLYKQNERTLHSVLDLNPFDTSKVFGQWIAQNCPGGFRWHVSGDVFNSNYAKFIVMVCENSPEIPHWIYTRSFHLVSVLTQAKNLTVNLSADSVNYGKAYKCHQDNGVRLCYLSTDGVVPETLPKGSVIFPDYSLRGKGLDNPLEHEWWKSLDLYQKRMVCPGDFFGQSSRHRCGPCQKCLK